MSSLDRLPGPVKRVALGLLIGLAGLWLQVRTFLGPAPPPAGEPSVALIEACDRHFSASLRLARAGEGNHRAWRQALAASDPASAAWHRGVALDALEHGLRGFEAVDAVHLQWAVAVPLGMNPWRFPGTRVHPEYRRQLQALRAELLAGP